MANGLLDPALQGWTGTMTTDQQQRYDQLTPEQKAGIDELIQNTPVDTTGSAINPNLSPLRQEGVMHGTNAPGVHMTEMATGQKQDRSGLSGGVHGRVGGPRSLGGVTPAAGEEGRDALRKYGMGPLATEEVGPDEYFTRGQTVEGRLYDLIEDKSNPLMQRRESQAMQQAQSRGLLNSTMAATAGQAAMIDAAMPIAQMDAQGLRDYYGRAHQADIQKDQMTWAHNLQVMMNQQNFDIEQQQWLTNSFTDLTGQWGTQMTSIMANKNLTMDEKNAMIKQGSDWINSSISTLAELNNFSYEL